MSYIGKSPSIGAYSMLDSLTASATASYSLTLDSVAFVPESANHLIVSLNGHIQKAGSSFTVSSSTLTFSSALTSSDSIDFVLALGSVLDIGTPSDATVTNAKTNFVSTSSAAGLQIKGDGTTDGTLQLNCSQNSHGIKLKSPAHSASASYTLTFPTTDGNADEFLKTDGSGVLSWATAGGGGFDFISKTTISSSATVDVDNIFSSSYNVYKVIINTITPATNNVYLKMRLLDNSGNPKTSDYYRSARGGNEAFSGSVNNSQYAKEFDSNAWDLTPAGSSVSSDTAYGGVICELNFYDPYSTSKRPKYFGNGHMTNQAGSGIHGSLFQGVYNADTSTQFRGLRFYFNSGNLASGTILVYGAKEA